MRRALIVGIDKYPGAILNGCVNDASAVATIIETNGDGSPNFDVELMTDVPTRAELLEAIVKLFDGEVDVALLYFSGHGSMNMIGGYIVTPDFNRMEPGISMNDILTLANQSKVKNKVIILDCCHSGAFGSQNWGDKPITQMIEGMSILTASRASEAAMEVNGHGIFTNLLLSALRGGAADIGGHITAGGIYAYIDQALGAWHQRPIFKTNITNFTPLRIIHPPVSKDTLRLITKYFVTPEDRFQLDPSYEFTNSPDVEHKVLEPYADGDHVTIFKNLQKFESIGLVVPVDTEHMYFAAMKSKSCRLTALGLHYWKLVKDKRI